MESDHYTPKEQINLIASKFIERLKDKSQLILKVYKYIRFGKAFFYIILKNDHPELQQLFLSLVDGFEMEWHLRPHTIRVSFLPPKYLDNKLGLHEVKLD